MSVRGGAIDLHGSPKVIIEQLEAWRAKYAPARQAADKVAEAPAKLPLDVSGLALSWAGFDATDAVQVVTGIHFERNSERQRAGFESAKLQSSWGSLSASSAAAELDSGPRGVALRAASIGQVLGQIAVPAHTEVATSASAPIPIATAGAASNAASARANDDATARDRTEPTLLERWLAPIATETWSGRRLELARLRKLASAALVDGAQLDVARVQLEIARGDSVLNVGPAPFRLRREGDLLSASLTPPAGKDGGKLEITGRLPLDEAPIEVSFEGGPISLHTLGVREGDFGLLGVERSQLTLATRIALSPEGALGISASGRLNRLSLQHAALAPEPLHDMDLAWGGQIHLDLQRRKLAIEEGVLGLERVRVQLGGAIEASADDLRVSVSVQVPKTPCQDLLEAAPRALLPQLEGLRLGGTFSLDARVEFDTAAPKDTRVDWDFDNRCKVIETPESVDPKRFREPFQHFVTDAEGRATELATGPKTEHWVPLSDISPSMETALIVCEDSRFFSHNGFDNKAIRDSILDNVRAGHFVRGASTLTMQLAKNLYLGREKTLSRKLQEAAFTLLLEERLSKEDILELYLNVVEFGPGVYGIRNAASHYFSSHPGELSLAQALYLGSVLPSPKANHFQEDGALRAGWAEHLHYLMRIAHKIRRISDDELEAGLAEQIVFGQAHPNSDSDFLFGTPLYELNDG
jgi:hypothetical protein